MRAILVVPGLFWGLVLLAVAFAMLAGVWAMIWGLFDPASL